MKNNETLQKNVEDAIKWVPLLNAAELGVTAKQGVVTLSGIGDSYAKKTEAEDAAKNVAGVKVLVANIDIECENPGRTNDGEIAREIVCALKLNWIPDNKVKVRVENGWVTLEGELRWNFQKEAAKKAVRYLTGVLGVVNDIMIKTESKDAIEKKDIEEALRRTPSTYGQNIRVDVYNDRVTLNGTVHSFHQKEEANRIAWNAPGVCAVYNKLVIENGV